MDTTGILKKLKDVDIKVICDVNNPLVGDEGCSTVFAPQKGADLQMVQRMEQAITRFYADLFAEDYDRWMAGAGAAGGLGYAFAYFLHAELVHGIDIVLQEIHLEVAVRTADLVITGEGRMDAQTLMGKTPGQRWDQRRNMLFRSLLMQAVLVMGSSSAQKVDYLIGFMQLQNKKEHSIHKWLSAI